MLRGAETARGDRRDGNGCRGARGGDCGVAAPSFGPATVVRAAARGWAADPAADAAGVTATGSTTRGVRLASTAFALTTASRLGPASTSPQLGGRPDERVGRGRHRDGRFHRRCRFDRRLHSWEQAPTRAQSATDVRGGRDGRDGNIGGSRRRARGRTQAAAPGRRAAAPARAAARAPGAGRAGRRSRPDRRRSGRRGGRAART